MPPFLIFIHFTLLETDWLESKYRICYLQKRLAFFRNGRNTFGFVFTQGKYKFLRADLAKDASLASRANARSMLVPQKSAIKLKKIE